jgi:hypothetical protein
MLLIVGVIVMKVLLLPVEKMKRALEKATAQSQIETAYTDPLRSRLSERALFLRSLKSQAGVKFL